MFYRDAKGRVIPDCYKFNVFITTYEILLTDIVDLKSIEWRVGIIDEAHRLKNKKCKLIQGLALLKLVRGCPEILQAGYFHLSDYY